MVYAHSSSIMLTASWNEKKVVDREVWRFKEAGLRENLMRADGINAQEIEVVELVMQGLIYAS